MSMMAPEEPGVPPELMQMLGGAPPEEEAAPELSPADHLRAAIEHAQAALVDEPDDADSQQLAAVVKSLYAILSGRQDAEDRASGGDPKQMRVLRRSYGG
jgi:hypothetical protein